MVDLLCHLLELLIYLMKETEGLYFPRMVKLPNSRAPEILRLCWIPRDPLFLPPLR